MSVLTEIFVMLLTLINGFIELYTYVIFAAVVISWVNADPYNQIVRFIRNITEPVMAPVRRRLWKLTRQLQLDLSPMVVIFGLFAIQIVIRRLIFVLRSGGF